MRSWILAALVLMSIPCTLAEEFSFEERMDLLVDGKPWLGTVITPYNEAKRESTYKVYTHIFDFAGVSPITKGMGGLYTHHRGLFIGWKDTFVNGVDYDTWHMANCTQRHVAWLDLALESDKASQTEQIDWCDPDGKPFISEMRGISAKAGGDGIRIFDFSSLLTSIAGTIQLKGDLQHAGMQVRLAQEVADHQDSTQYILPEGAKEEDDDRVVGAWWVCCSAVIRDTRYWVMHMTQQTIPGGVPIYSIRRYARFGAFFEPEIKEGEPLHLSFRVLVSTQELDQASCAKLYQEYVGTQP